MEIESSSNGVLRKFMQNRPLTHLAFWASYILFFTYIWGSYDDNYKEEFTMICINLPAKVMIVYLKLKCKTETLAIFERPEARAISGR